MTKVYISDIKNSFFLINYFDLFRLFFGFYVVENWACLGLQDRIKESKNTIYLCNYINSLYFYDIKGFVNILHVSKY